MKAFQAIVLASICTFLSCESLVDIDAEGTVSGDDVLSNEHSIQQALMGAYYSLGGIYDGADGGELLGGDFQLMATLLTRRNQTEIAWDVVNAPSYDDFIDKDILETNLRVEANWRRAYEVINLVNLILANLDNVQDAAARNRIEGEALAIRGILYFEMVRLWGPQYRDETLSTPAIPLITEPFTSIDQIGTPELATVGQIYTHAEGDLTQANSRLESLGQNGVYLNHFVCKAYLMRMALQKNEHAEAEGFANAIISGPFELRPSPLMAFNNVNNTSEDIFAIQQTQANTAGDRSTGTGLPNFFSSLSSSGIAVMRIREVSLFTDLANGPQFSAQDVRGTIETDVDSTSTFEDVAHAGFYTNILNISTLSSTKYNLGDRVLPVARLAEVHLSRAEAIFEQNVDVIHPTALQDLNRIRTRAGLDALQASDFADSFAFYDSLVLERKRELLYEGVLFHDLKRWATYLDVEMGANNDPLDPKFILPIPQSERDTWTD